LGTIERRAVLVPDGQREPAGGAKDASELSDTAFRTGQVVQAEVAHHGVEGVIGVPHLLAVADLEAGGRVESDGQLDHGVTDIDSIDYRATLQRPPGHIARTAAGVEQSGAASGPHGIKQMIGESCADRTEELVVGVDVRLPSGALKVSPRSHRGHPASTVSAPQAPQSFKPNPLALGRVVVTESPIDL
jgi:hypothetical protein